jgi:hypothetical protein
MHYPGHPKAGAQGFLLFAASRLKKSQSLEQGVSIPGAHRHAFFRLTITGSVMRGTDHEDRNVFTDFHSDRRYGIG